MNKFKSVEWFYLAPMGTSLLFLIACSLNCHSSNNSASTKEPSGYPIASQVVTTQERTLAFSVIASGLQGYQLDQVSKYGQYGYGDWTFGPPLVSDPRADPTTFGIMPAGYDYTTVTQKTKLL